MKSHFHRLWNSKFITSVSFHISPSIRFPGGFFSSGKGSRRGMEGATAGGISGRKKKHSSTMSHVFCLSIQGLN